jgi:hypothetical protein
MLWMNFAVKAGFSWPNEPVEIPFQGALVVLSPETERLSCTASLFDPAGFEFDAGATRLSRFLSRLAWSQRGGIEEHFSIGTNDPARPGRLGKGTYATSGWANVEPWQQLYLPSPPSAKAELALGLFREGMTVNSEPLAFLSFFKVLNVVYPTGSDQKAWLKRNLPAATDLRAKERLAQLSSNYVDLADYLYVQGRCAVAHAFDTPVADPDAYEDRRRLRDDLPLIKTLAEHCIDQELHVPTEHNFRQRHRNSHKLPPEYLFPEVVEGGRVRYTVDTR